MEASIIDSQREYFILKKEKIESEIQSINSFIERKIQLIVQLKGIRIQTEKEISDLNEEPKIEAKKDLSLIDRIFRKKVVKMTPEEYADILHQRSVKLDELESKETKLDQEITEAEKDLENLQKRKKELEVLLQDNDVILKRFEEKDITLNDLVILNPNLCNDAKFMKELIKDNFLSIKYDKSNDKSLYVNFLNIIISSMDSINDGTNYEYDKGLINSIIKELTNPTTPSEDKYTIPVKYLFEEIRRVMSSYEKLDEDSIRDIVFSLTSVLDRYETLNNKLPKEYGEEMERLWEDDSIRIGIHATSNPDIIDTIFKKGLRCSQQQKGYLDLKFTSIVQGFGLSFFQLLDYNTLVGDRYIVFALPVSCFDEENPTPIWGSHNSEVTGDEYVLPEYMLGVVPPIPLNEAQDGLDYSKRMFIHKTVKEHESYEYYHQNGVDYTQNNNRFFY